MNGLRPNQAWTGGQYSLVRSCAAATVACLLLRASFASGDFGAFTAALGVASLFVAIGAGGRAIPLLLALLLPFSAGSEDHSATMVLASLWLGLHLAVPGAPYGSVAAAGREDPRGEWQIPGWYPAVWRAVFVFSRLGAATTALTDGHESLAVAFLLPGLLALAPSTALLGWSLSFGLDVALTLGGAGSLAYALLLHLFTFQPSWIPRSQGGEDATVFYDGTCALCHGAVRFLLSEDSASRFRIAPLGGPAFLRRVPESVRLSRPDSVVLVIGDRVLMRGSAAVEVLGELGGLWWVVSGMLRILPRALVDAVYDAIAARRYRWFGRREDACPLMPAAERARFDA